MLYKNYTSNWKSDQHARIELEQLNEKA